MSPTASLPHARAYLAAALAFLIACFLVPLALAPMRAAQADTAPKVGAISYNGNTSDGYVDVDDLLTDLEALWDDPDVESATVDMYCDWDTQEYGDIEVAAGKTLTLNMHGHMLDRHDAAVSTEWTGYNGGQVITLQAGAKLTVYGGAGEDAQTSHHGYLGDKHTDAEGNVTYAFWKPSEDGTFVIKGGLITGGTGSSSTSAGGISAVGDNCSIYLYDVTVAGNMSDKDGLAQGHGGGIALHGQGCYLYTNNAHIVYNHAEGTGGGIFVRKSGCTLYLAGGSEVSHNYACGNGGGIAFDTSNAALDLMSSYVSYNASDSKGGGVYAHTEHFQANLNYGEICHNTAKSHGGGLYLDRSDFNIGGAGSSISYNTSTNGDGGGVCLGIDESDSYKNSFISVGIEGNTAPNGNGGGLYLNQEQVQVGGTFLNNKAGKDGGAICISNDDNEIKSDVIKGNTANGNGGGIYNDKWNTLVHGVTITENVAGKEGGGIFSAYSDDIELGGVIIIRDNKRADGADDDLFLSSNFGNTIRAYVYDSYLWPGSCVGIRTGIDGDRLIATKVDRYSEGTFFLNQSDKFHLSYSDESKELYQRTGSLKYLTTVNGQGETRYSQGDTVTLNANSFGDGKAFVRWEVASSTGLWNINSVISDPEQASITFTMPGNDVHLVAVFSEVECQTSVQIDVDAPEAGKELPTTALLTYTGANGMKAQALATVSWEEVSAIGETTPAQGVAKYATAYSPTIIAPRDLEAGLAFQAAMNSGDVDLRVGDTQVSTCTQASVDSKTGALTAYAQAMTTALPVVTFDPANGDDTFTQEVAGGAFALEPAEPVREGYEFLGWFTAEGILYRFNETVDADITLTAHWDLVPPTSFTDVPEGTWFHDWVAQASTLRLMTGYKDDEGAYTGQFGPDDAITRGEVAVVLWRLASCPQAQDGGVFPDVEAGAFYAEAVSWCASKGIVTGYQAGANKGRFLPDAAVSREELALMVWRFESWASVNVAGAPEEALKRCADAESVSHWAREACVWCAAAGIMTGKETAEGTLRLDPQQGTTRAQAAKMLVRAYRILWREVDPYAWMEGLVEEQDGEQNAQADETQAGEEQAGENATFEDVAFEDVTAGETPAEGAQDAAPEEGAAGSSKDSQGTTLEQDAANSAEGTDASSVEEASSPEQGAVAQPEVDPAEQTTASGQATVSEQKVFLSEQDIAGTFDSIEASADVALAA